MNQPTLSREAQGLEEPAPPRCSTSNSMSGPILCMDLTCLPSLCPFCATTLGLPLLPSAGLLPLPPSPAALLCLDAVLVFYLQNLGHPANNIYFSAWLHTFMNCPRKFLSWQHQATKRLLAGPGRGFSRQRKKGLLSGCPEDYFPKTY